MKKITNQLSHLSTAILGGLLLSQVLQPLSVYATDLTWAPTGNTQQDWTWGLTTPTAWMNGASQVGFANGDDVLFSSEETNILEQRTILVNDDVQPKTMTFTGDQPYSFNGAPISIGLALTLEGSGTISFSNLSSTPQLILNSGELIFPGNFDAGEFSATGGKLKAGGSGDITFTFSIPKNKSTTINCDWDKGSSNGIFVHKKGEGTATLNVKKLFPAHNQDGRIYIDEGRMIASGYGWGSRSGPTIYEVSGGAVLSLASNHALGDYWGGPQIFLHPGGTFDPVYSQYIGQGDPGLWLMGNATVRGDIRNEGELYVKAEGKGNYIELLRKQSGVNLYINVLEDGELYIDQLELSQTCHKEGTGTLFLATPKYSTAECPLEVSAGTLVSTNSFTSISLTPIQVLDGASFENGTSGIFWFDNTASTSAGTGAFRGLFGAKTATQNFTGKLTVEGGFYIREEGFQANYTGLTVKGFLGVDHGASRPFSIPDTFSTEHITVARVTAGAERPAKISGSVFPVPLELVSGACVLIPICYGEQPATLQQGVTFAPDATVKLAPADTYIQSGTYPVFTGLANIPDTLPQISGHMASMETAEWVFENGNLCVKITETQARSLLTWRPEQGGDSADWSGEAANWESEGGTGPSVFTIGSPALFDGNEPNVVQKITVAEGQTPGNLTFSSALDYILEGSKLEGASPMLKSGTGTLTINGGGFSAHPIHITEGCLKMGADALTKSLGDPALPIKVSGNGTFDVNYSVPDNANDPDRNELTHRKFFQIEGDGVEREGALVNNGVGNCYRALSRVELTGDATIGGTARFDMRSLDDSEALQKRPLLVGPDKELTVKNQTGFGLVSTDVQVKNIIVSEGGILRPEEDTRFTLQGGIDLRDGIFNPYASTVDFTFPINALSGNNKILSANNGGVFRGPLTIEADSLLELADSKSSFYGAITNKGTLRVTSGEQSILGNVWSDSPIEVTGGTLTWKEEQGISPTLENSRTIKIEDGTFKYLPYKFKTDGDLTLTGESGSVFLGNPYVQGGIMLTNTTIRTSGKIGVSDPSNYGFVTFGNGCDIEAGNLYLGEVGSNPLQSQVRILPDSELEVTKGDTRIGHWSSNPLYQYELSIEGGTYRNTNECTFVGWDAPHASLQMFDGLMDVKGIMLHGHLDMANQINNSDYFVMHGGRLLMGASGLTTTRNFFENGSGVYLNGGTISNTVPWGTTSYLNLAFAGDPVIWDLGNSLVNFAVPLQGDGDVTIQGNAAFNSSPENDRSFYSAGSVRGHWTIANQGETSLKNAAAFSKGLTLEENTPATISIQGSGYVRFCILGNMSAEEGEAQKEKFYYLDREMPYAHQAIAAEHTAYLYTGEFYVSSEQAGTWTFAESYNDEACLSIDGTKVLNDNQYNVSTSGQIELEEGWHKFRLAVQQQTGGRGPQSQSWINKEMGIGWACTATTELNASAYTRFSPDKLPMRPGITNDDRLQLAGNSVSWSHGTGTKYDWKTSDSWTFKAITNSLEMVSIQNWDLGKMAVNRFTGWFYVDEDKVGEWYFWGSYDDYCMLRVDGFDTGFNGNNPMYASRNLYLSRGWHRFELRTFDGGGKCGPWYVSQGAAVQYRINNGKWYAFDESTLPFRASLALPNTDYGFIGGELELKNGSLLKNEVSDDTDPCIITSTLKGSGTLSGPFAFSTNAVWEVSGDKSDLTEVVQIGEGAYPKMLKNLRKVKAVFLEKPGRTTYRIADSLGLEDLTNEELKSIQVIATDPTGEKNYPFTAGIRNGKFVLVNKAPVGMILFLH